MISSSSSSSSSARFFRFPPPPPRGVPSGAVAERDFAAKPRCVSKSASPMVFVSVSLSWRSCATRPSSSPGPAVSTLCVLPRRVASTTNADHAVFPMRRSAADPTMSRDSLARVIATFSRRSSAKKPSRVVRTHEKTTTSASWPWYPSTVPHRTFLEKKSVSLVWANREAGFW